MVIITDGSANVPLKKSLETGEVRDIDEIRVIVREYEDVAVKDAISVSKIMRREGVHTVVINTNPSIFGREAYGHVVTEIIASTTKGSHHALGRLSSEDMVESMIDRIKEDQRTIVYKKTPAHTQPSVFD
jgi:Mg-chelatase subunit ChlD